MPAGGPRRLNWEWEELVLACDLVVQNNRRYVDDRDPRAIALSQVLRQMELHPREDRLPDFRNPNGVAQKTRNLVQHFPGYAGSTSRGSRKDREVVERFLADPGGMHKLADSVRAAVAAGEPLPPRLPEQPEPSDRAGTGITADDLVHLISTLHVRWSNRQPALYQPITLLWAIGRAFRGDPRIETWEVTKLQVGDLLERFGFRGERPRPDYPVAALFNAGLWELETGGVAIPRAHGDAELKRWFDNHAPSGGLAAPAYELLRHSAPTRVVVVRTVLDTYFQGTDYVELLEDVGLTDTGIAAGTDESDDQAIGQSPLEDAYRRLCGLAERSSKQNAGKRVSRASKEPIRSATARRAVLLRSEGHCENPECIGHPDVLTDAGDPILEIDHIHDLAKDGPDDPVQMIALCPNCHAVKTRGRNREQLRQRLFEIALERHQLLIS